MAPAPEAQTRIVSVVVPVYNDPRLAACLEALARLALPQGWRLETVVVDNGSRDPVTSLCARWPDVRFLVETRKGSYAARNTGLRSTTGEVVAFTDSDCRPAHHWLLVALRRLADEPGIAAVAGRVQTVFDTDGPTTAPGWWDKVEAFPQRRYVASGFGVTANLIVRREAGAAVGWFDDEFLSGGDANFGRRLTASGRTIVYEDAAVVAHPARTTWHELFSKGRRTAQAHARVEHLRRRGAKGYLVSTYSSLVQLGGVMKTSVTHPELMGIRGRGQYLIAGVAYRVFWFVTLCRWRIYYRRQDARGGLRQTSLSLS